MPIVNPYAKKKTSSSAPVVRKPLAATANTAKTPTLVKKPIDEGGKKNEQVRPLPTSAPPLTAPKRPPAVSHNAANLPPPRRLVTPSATTKMLPAKKAKKPTSLKAQLKQQIQDLKMKKKLEKERKLMEKRLKERETERLRQEAEIERLRQEYELKRKAEEKVKEQERLKGEKERLRLEEEKRKQGEVKAAEREAKEQEKEHIRQEKQKQRDLEYQQRLQAYQQRQMLQYGFVPNAFPQVSTPSQMPAGMPSNFSPMASYHQPSYQQAAASPMPDGSFSPMTPVPANAASIPVQPAAFASNDLAQVTSLAPLATSKTAPVVQIVSVTGESKPVADLLSPLNSRLPSLLSTALIPTPPKDRPLFAPPAAPVRPTMVPAPPAANIPSYQLPPYTMMRPSYHHHPTSMGPTMTTMSQHHMPFPAAPSHSAAMMVMHHHSMPPPSSTMMVQRWMAPPSRPISAPRAVAPKILSRNPLQQPSPFGDCYELVQHKFIIVKEDRGSFGVSVEVKTDSVLIDPDLWETLMRPPLVASSSNANIKEEKSTIVAKVLADTVATSLVPATTLAKEAIATISATANAVVSTQSAESNTVSPAVAVELSPKQPAIEQKGNESVVAMECSLPQTNGKTMPELQALNPPTPLIDGDDDKASLLPSGHELLPTQDQGLAAVAGLNESIKGEDQAKNANMNVNAAIPLKDILRSPVQEMGTIKDSPDATENSDSTESTQSPCIQAANVSIKDTLPPTQTNMLAVEKQPTSVHPAGIQLAAAPVITNVLPVEPVSASIAPPIQAVSQHRRKRRKRAYFHVMSVLHALKQNEKNPKIDLNKKLKPGDLILEINGQTTGGLPFHEACQLFAGCSDPKKNDPTNDEKTGQVLIECSLLVARRKSKPVPPPSKVHIAIQKAPSAQKPLVTPFAVNTDAMVSGDFTADEIKGLAEGTVMVLISKDRPLGYEASPDTIRQCMSAPSLAVRDQTSIQRKLIHLQSSIDATYSNTATTYWKLQWEANHKEVEIPEVLRLDFMTLAQLCSIRALPRPPRGCRCGSSDHEYVNSPKCILYYRLRKLSSKSATNLPPNKTPGLETSLKDLSAVETAFKDRIIKMKEEQEQEKAEAKFVDEMEKTQTRHEKRAIFAPNFSTMVLCAIAAIGPTFDKSVDSFLSVDEDAKDEVVETNPIIDGEKDEEDKDEDDLPLFSLGKRQASDSIGSAAKKAKRELDMASLGFHPAFLAQLLTYMSHTWGHVYRESSHSDYTWRWEVHHGQTADRAPKREKSKNPRPPGSLSMANMEFAIIDESIDRLKRIPFAVNSKWFGDGEAAKTQRKQWAEDMISLAYLVSPKKTGLLDEVKALLQLGIIRKSKQGAAVLSKEWFARVDPLVLEDMDMKWSLEADPDNKYLINGKVKRDLANYWIRVDGAWALNEDLSELVFLDNEWGEWRRSFEDEAEKRADDEDGIGKFGI
jgi:hypothetical protein